MSAVALSGCGGEVGERDGAEAVPDSVLRRAALSITPQDMLDRIGVLAHDSMRGRRTPSPELDAVADWIAHEFERMGLQGPFGGEFVQRYPIRRVRLDAAGTWAVPAGGSDTLRAGSDFRFPFGPPAAPGPIRAPAAAVRLGGELPDRSEVEGVHVFLGSPERSVSTAESLRWVSAIRALGPAAVWVVSDEDDRSWGANSNLAGAQTLIGSGADAPLVTVRRARAGRALGLSEEETAEVLEADAPVRTEQAVSLQVALDVISDDTAPNAAALLPGSDPELGQEVVVFSAHMDHVGVGRPDETGDSIYNGADDDASGTAAVLEIAEAMAALPAAPRRSTLFLLVSGEEQGLWGSQVFVEEAPMPVSRMVAALNADMVGRNWSDTIVAIGREHSDLGRTLDEVAARHPELGMTPIDDLWPEENFYGRSDHYNFARAGVPILFFFNGTHEDYHRPSDEVERIDPDKAARVARLMFYLGFEIAERDEPPEWRRSSRRRIVGSD